METGEIAMENLKCWTASSKSVNEEKMDDLTALAGKWNSGLNVTISNPATVTLRHVVYHITKPCVSEQDIIDTR